jgi:four helix bundle protein
MPAQEKGHKQLEVYQLAHQLAVKIHKMTMGLPSFERYEEGSQVRRSAKSISSNIVEGYALRRYKAEFVHYLFRSYGSAEETIEHLELLLETGSLTDKVLFENLRDEYNRLAGKLLRYIQAVDGTFEKPFFVKESTAEYDANSHTRDFE